MTATPTTTTKTDVKTLEAQHVLQTYRRMPVVFERGDGMRLFDDRGPRVPRLPLRHRRHVARPRAPGAGQRARRSGARRWLHTSNLYFHPLQGQLAARLSTLSGLERAFFCNSGTEAIEACLKFARRYWHTLGDTARTRVSSRSTHSFHGRTMGSLSVTWDEHYRAPFEPLIPGVTFVDGRPIPPASPAVVDDTTAAIIVEPIQGEGGVRPLSAGVCAGDQRGLRAHGRPAHCRRGAVRIGPHRPAVLLRRHRPEAASRWRSARRSAPACRWAPR